MSPRLPRNVDLTSATVVIENLEKASTLAKKQPKKGKRGSANKENRRKSNANKKETEDEEDTDVIETEMPLKAKQAKKSKRVEKDEASKKGESKTPQRGHRTLAKTKNNSKTTTKKVSLYKQFQAIVANSQL